LAKEAQEAAEGVQSTSHEFSNFHNEMSKTEREVSELVNEFARFTTLAGALHIVVNAVRSAY
jgi:hypothetical protein